MQKYNLSLDQRNLMDLRMSEEIALTSVDDINNKQYMKTLEQSQINLVKNKSDKHCINELERELLSDHEMEMLEIDAIEMIAEQPTEEPHIMISEIEIQEKIDEILYKKNKG
ncbi:MAG: hypothetical protein ACTSU7_11330 [Candidatus Heimdallarchaeaceae archaeon]